MREKVRACARASAARRRAGEYRHVVVEEVWPETSWTGRRAAGGQDRGGHGTTLARKRARRWWVGARGYAAETPAARSGRGGRQRAPFSLISSQICAKKSLTASPRRTWYGEEGIHGDMMSPSSFFLPERKISGTGRRQVVRVDPR